MAKRKQKKKQASGLPWQLTLLIVIGIATFYFTRNLDVTVYAVIGTAFAMIVIAVWKKIRLQQPTTRVMTHSIDDMTGIELE